MIDQDLISENVILCSKQIEAMESTAIPGLFQINDFFTPTLIAKILSYVEKQQNWIQVEQQGTHKNIEHMNRTRIAWDFDTVFEEVFIIFTQLTDPLNKRFGKEFKFTGLQIWKDDAGYMISNHYDNYRIGYSAQIYLTGGVPHLGTYFYSQDITVETPYKENCGYITDGARTTLHGMVNPVPEGHTRYSIYGTWL